jgi:tellurite methyltransferase
MTCGDRHDPPRPFWEASYQDDDAATFGPPSSELDPVVASLPRGARALDLGCGDGRNTLHLARLGCEVDAVDISERGVGKLRRLLRREGLEARAWVQDAATLILRRSYHLVVCQGLLHLLPQDARLPLVERLKEATLPGGRHVVDAFSDRIPSPPDLAPFTPHLLAEGELARWYGDWGVSFRSWTLQDEHPGGVRHRHAVNSVVARRHR